MSVHHSFSHQASSGRELLLHPILPPSTSSPSQPTPSHPIPPRLIPPHSIPSYMILLKPISSLWLSILRLSISWPCWMTAHRTGDSQGHPAPTPDAAPASREGLTTAFAYQEALQGKPGLDPTRHSSCQVCTQHFCFPVHEELLRGLFLACRA